MNVQRNAWIWLDGSMALCMRMDKQMHVCGRWILGCERKTYEYIGVGGYVGVASGPKWPVDTQTI